MDIDTILPVAYSLVVTENEEQFNKETIDKIKIIAANLLDKLNIRREFYEEYLNSIIRIISEIVASNVLMFDDPNLDWTEKFIELLFVDCEEVISIKGRDDIKVIIIKNLSEVIAKYNKFHNYLYFNDDITIDKIKFLNDTSLKHGVKVLLDIYSYLIKNKKRDHLTHFTDLAGKVYANTIAGLYDALISNPKRIVDYTRRPDKFLNSIEDLFIKEYTSIILGIEDALGEVGELEIITPSE